MIARRHVFLVIGYAAVRPEQQHAWFRRSIEKFGRLWSATGQVSDLTVADDKASAWWTAKTQGPNWQVETTYEYLAWDDIIDRDFERPIHTQVAGSVLTFFDWVFTGTLWRYFRSSWKYAMFFLAAYLQSALMFAIGLLAGYLLSLPFDLGPLARTGMTLAIAVAVFIGLLRLLSERWRTQHLFVDWIFSWEFVRGKRPDMEERLDVFVDKIIASARRADVDEIIIVGHCIGAGLAITMLDRALDRDPAFLRHGPDICLLTVGATIPKFALHPAGGRFRKAAQRLADEPLIRWAEYHMRDDAISFYRFDPVSLTRTSTRIDRKPVIHRVQLHNMLKPETARRVQFKFMRVHVQPIMPNEQRAIYDYFLTVCGPVPFGDMIVAPGGARSLFAPDGSLIEAALPGRAAEADARAASAAV